MRKLTFTVPAEYGDAQLKGFLRHFCGVSARLLTDLKKEPLGITVNGAHATVRKILQVGLYFCLTIKSKRQGIRAWFLISASLMNSPLSIAV